MKRYAYRYMRFPFFARSSIEAYLAKMAQKGLIVDKTGTVLWRFRRTEPQDLRFCGIYSPSRTEFDSGLSEDEQNRVEFCAHDGWQLCSKWQQMLIFKNENLDAVPIETDTVMQLSVIERTMKKAFFPQQLILLFLCIIQLATQLVSLSSSPVRFYTNAISVAMLPFWGFLLFGVLIDIARSVLWMRKAARTAEHGTLPEYGSCSIPFILQITALILLIALILFSPQWRIALSALLVFPIIALGNGLKNLLKRKNVSAAVNRTVTMLLVLVLTILMLAGISFVVISDMKRNDAVGSYQSHGISFEVYDDALPITIEMLYTVPEDIAWSKEKQTRSSMLAQSTDCRQWPLTDDPEVPELTYAIHTSRFAFVLDAFEKELLSSSITYHIENSETVHSYYEEIPAAPWGAVRAWHRFDFDKKDHLLLRFSEHLIQITLPYEADDAQTAKLADILSAYR